jgi:hypothetical protein
MWCYGNTCANDRLIRLNKFIWRFTDGFCNLFFISIRTPDAIPRVIPDVTLQNFTPCICTWPESGGSSILLLHLAWPLNREPFCSFYWKWRLFCCRATWSSIHCKVVIIKFHQQWQAASVTSLLSDSESEEAHSCSYDYNVYI